MARQARYVVQKAPGVGGTPIAEDEPCIVIRAQDKLALASIDYYLTLYATITEAVGSPSAPDVIAELYQHRHAIEEWQRTHPTKLADR